MSTRNKILLLMVLSVGLTLVTAPGFAARVTHVGNISKDLFSPTSLLVTDDGIAVLEPFKKQVVVFSPDGILTCRVNVSGEIRALARLELNRYLFCEQSTGNVFQINLETAQQDVFLANAGDPIDVIVSGGRCRILDASQSRVLVCDMRGLLIETINLAIPENLTRVWLSDLAWDNATSRYYAWDQTNSHVLAFASDGKFLGQFSSFGSDEGAVTRGGEIVCDQEGWIYVTDRYQGQIIVFDSAWNFVMNIQPVEFDQSPLVLPAGLAVDPTGFIYVACTEGASIEVFHLDKSETSIDMPLAAAVSPADGDTLTTGDLHLVAGIQAPAHLANDLRVEFKVFDWVDTGEVVGEVVAEVADLPLDEFTYAGELVVGTVSWNLPESLAEGKPYGWQARAVSGSYEGHWSALRQFSKGVLPPVLRLEQNIPNPFNPRTVISFVLTGKGNSQLAIFDIGGRLVQRQDLSAYGAGRHEIVWNGTDASGATMSSGIYFYRLMEGNQSVVRKMMLVR